MPNHNPVVTAKDANLQSGQSITAASLIGAVTDQDGDRIAQYRFYDPGTDGGHFILNGVVQPAGTWITVTAAQLSALSYVGGSAAGSKSLQVAASDGKGWSTTAVAKVTIAGPLDKLQDAGIRADVAGLMRNNSLDHASLLHILQDVAVGGVTASEFSTLKTLDSLLNAAGGITTSKADAYLADALINGNAANAHWTGGNAASVALGNLKAGTSQTQMSELIGKWFLGTDHPGLKDSSGATAEYALDPDPLYGSSGTPRWQDFHQAGLGDCYLVAAVGQIALREPGAITSMFTDNHDGTYGVRFYDWNDKPVYVTVDSQIPYFKTPDPVTGERVTPFGGPEIGATDRAKWGALIEKAYVQLNDSGTEYDHDVLAQYAKKYGPNAIPYLGEERGNHYIDIQAGYSELIHYVTGKHVTETENIEDPNILNALRGNQEVILSFNGEDSDRFLSQHMYQVLDYREDTHAFELRNPWGSNDYCVFWATPEKITAQKPEIFYASGATHFAAEA